MPSRLSDDTQPKDSPCLVSPVKVMKNLLTNNFPGLSKHKQNSVKVNQLKPRPLDPRVTQDFDRVGNLTPK